MKIFDIPLGKIILAWSSEGFTCKSGAKENSDIKGQCIWLKLLVLYNILSWKNLLVHTKTEWCA